MVFSDRELQVCRMAAFIEREMRLAQTSTDEERISPRAVLLRYREEISPEAKLVLGDQNPVIDLRLQDWVQCRSDGVWTFGASHPEFMMMDVGTDGSISVDEGMAEVIFNYVND